MPEMNGRPYEDDQVAELVVLATANGDATVAATVAGRLQHRLNPPAVDGLEPGAASW